jgi:hypothetical protein
MCTPVSTISACAWASCRASRTSASGRRERLAPRASTVAQNVQCSSHPSWILSQAREPEANRRSPPAGSARSGTPSARATAPSSAPGTTAATLGSAARRPSSTAAAHPITTVLMPGFRRASRRTSPRIFPSPTCVTVHEFTIAASARSGVVTTRQPASCRR